MKYNYVILGTPDQYYKISYQDINKLNNCLYIAYPDFSGNPIMSFLRRVHMSPKLRRFIELPHKNMWNKYLTKVSFNNDKPFCFIFFSAGPFAEHIPYGFVEYLKKSFPRSKYVVFYQDLVNKERRVSLDEYKNKMDLVISFDHSDCNKYGLLYHPLVYSDVEETIESEVKLESDVYFCGAVKDRLEDILAAYYFFYKNELICDFILVTKDNTLGKKYENLSGLRFVSDFNYLDNLKHIKKCKYMLEIMQKGGTGHTIRTYESIAFNKKLISNNSCLPMSEYYNSDDYIVYDNVENLHIKEIREKLNTECSLRKYIKSISPVEFIYFIEEELNKKG